MHEKMFREFCKRIGEDATRAGLQATPKRLKELESILYAGYSLSPKDALGHTFANNGIDEMITIKDISFYSMCEHHLLPFFGSVHIGYVPKDSIAGISGFVRLVEVYAKRLQIQENLTNQIAQSITKLLKPKGVMVVCEARHLCMSMRGAQKSEAKITTSALRGIFKSDSRTRAEFLQLIKS
ncbi:GTP cyclohydrolase I FolE [Helicobacter sp. T3_23-1056]